MAEQRSKFLNKAEEVVDEVLRHGKHILPHMARFCVVGTFLDDSIRTGMQWHEQRDNINATWGCGAVLATMYVLVNLVGQLAGCMMVLTRKHVKVACGILFGIIALQTVVFSKLWYDQVLRQLAVVGGVILLLAESRTERKNLFAGLPSLGGENNRKTYMQLSSRVLIVLMFLTVFDFSFTIGEDFVQDIIGIVFIMLIAVGYKTKLASLALVLYTTALNMYTNAWWSIPHKYQRVRDAWKYDFFQLQSVVGGLLLVVALGPGAYSVDERKKNL